MPRPIAEVEKAARPLAERILDFLRAAPPGQAYTLPEIYSAVEAIDPQSASLLMAMWAVVEARQGTARDGSRQGTVGIENKWSAALDQLVSEAKLEKRIAQDRAYYWAVTK